MLCKAIVEIKYYVNYVNSFTGENKTLVEFDTMEEAIAWKNAVEELNLFSERLFVSHYISSVKNLEKIEEQSAE